MANASDVECCPFGVFFVLDYQVNDLGDMSSFIGGAIDIVDWDCSRQSMSLYVLQLYKFYVNEHSGAPELTRASMNMGVLLSTVLRCRGTSVPLQSKVDCTRKGSLEGCSGGCSGMTCLVLRSMMTGDSGFNISLVDPTVLVSKTENMLV